MGCACELAGFVRDRGGGSESWINRGGYFRPAKAGPELCGNQRLGSANPPVSPPASGLGACFTRTLVLFLAIVVSLLPVFNLD